MNCHKCPHAADVAAGKFSDMEFSKTPCFGCRGEPELIRSVPLLPSDAARSTEADADAPSVARRLTLSGVVVFLVKLMALDSELRDILLWRFLGLSFEEIGARLGTTAVAAHLRLQTAIRRMPDAARLLAYAQNKAAYIARARGRG